MEHNEYNIILLFLIYRHAHERKKMLRKLLQIHYYFQFRKVSISKIFPRLWKNQVILQVTLIYVKVRIMWNSLKNFKVLRVRVA